MEQLPVTSEWDKIQYLCQGFSHTFEHSRACIIDYLECTLDLNPSILIKFGVCASAHQMGSGMAYGAELYAVNGIQYIVSYTMKLFEKFNRLLFYYVNTKQGHGAHSFCILCNDSLYEYHIPRSNEDINGFFFLLLVQAARGKVLNSQNPLPTRISLVFHTYLASHYCIQASSIFLNFINIKAVA